MGDVERDFMTWVSSASEEGLGLQNRYVGDVGDFGKYHLLKVLSQGQGTGEGVSLSLGVVWYLVPDESHNADGKHIRYLDGSRKERF